MSTRGKLIKTEQLMGDWNAVKRGKVARRVGRRIARRWTGRALGRIFG